MELQPLSNQLPLIQSMQNGSGMDSISITIEIISSLISYPQTNLIIGQGLSFSIPPNLTKVSTLSIISGSLPIQPMLRMEVDLFLFLSSLISSLSLSKEENQLLH